MAVESPETQRMANRLKVLYFTSVYLGGQQSGGTLVCAEHIRILSSLDSVDLTVVTTGPGAALGFIENSGTAQFNLDYRKLEKPLRPQVRSLRPSRRWPFPWELLAGSQPHIDENLGLLLLRTKPDVVVVDYVLSAIWAPNVYRTGIPCITITLNREAEFFSLARRLGNVQPDTSPTAVAEWRLNRFERWVYRNSAAVVALSKGDVPKTLPRGTEGLAIEPMLAAREPRWRYAATKRLFFVGNVAHFPNLEAIQWLATRFAPALASTDPEARIVIIGASAKSVPSHWLHPNIEFLGQSTKEQVERHFTASDLFVVPISNDFGSKIKVLECLSYGAPLIATREALSGIPFAESIPQFRLDDPEGAAKLAIDLMGDASTLNTLGKSLAVEMREARAASTAAWQQLIGRAALSSAHRPLMSTAKGVLNWARRLLPTFIKEVDVSDENGAILSGVYGAERLGDDLLRWTDGNAQFMIPLGRGARPRQLILRFWCIAAPDGTDIRILANGTELHRGRITKDTPEEALTLRLGLPDSSAAEFLDVDIESSVFRPVGDERELGVAIKSVRLAY